MLYVLVVFFFFFNDTATTEIYTLSLHDALPILVELAGRGDSGALQLGYFPRDRGKEVRVQIDSSEPIPNLKLDRKSTRLNSSHANISYAVFCLKKKKKYTTIMCRLSKYISGTVP